MHPPGSAVYQILCRSKSLRIIDTPPRALQKMQRERRYCMANDQESFASHRFCGETTSASKHLACGPGVRLQNAASAASFLSVGTPIPTHSHASAAFSGIRWNSRVHGPRREMLPHAGWPPMTPASTADYRLPTADSDYRLRLSTDDSRLPTVADCAVPCLTAKTRRREVLDQ